MPSSGTFNNKNLNKNKKLDSGYRPIDTFRGDRLGHFCIARSIIILHINEESIILLPAGLFAAAGFYQMAVWAIGKHRNYKKEFQEYPKGRKAILPFIL